MGVVIVGNAGAARECYWLLRVAREADAATPPFKGFLAWQGYAGELCELTDFSLGSSEDYQPAPDDLFVIGIGNPALRLAVYDWLRQRRAAFYTLRHPNVYICPSATVGEANIFQRDCVVQPNARIGNANFFNGGVIVGHDAVIGHANTFNLHVGISGHARLGDANRLAPRCILLENAKVGSWNVFAPGAVVYKGCRDCCLMVGNPALIEKRYAAPSSEGAPHE